MHRCMTLALLLSALGCTSRAVIRVETPAREADARAWASGLGEPAEVECAGSFCRVSMGDGEVVSLRCDGGYCTALLQCDRGH